MMMEMMNYLFEPCSVAIIGVSNNFAKWGFIILHNLLMGRYPGKIYPINPKEKEILGFICYPSVLEVPGEIDLALITIPAQDTPKAVKECVEKKVKAIVVISAGFAELGKEGEALQKELKEIAEKAGIALVGPNGQGISCPKSNLHPWMPVYFPKSGKVAIISQSGNLSTWLAEGLENFGFGVSKAVSAGNMASLDWADYLKYFAKDPDTKVILLYIEGIKDGRSFMESAYQTSLIKPIVVLKGGRTPEGFQTARSHTGVMAGEEGIFSSVCKQVGIIRTESMNEAVIISAGLVASPIPKGKRVGILTSGGGLGVIAADYCKEHNLELAQLSEKTIEQLKKILPPWWVPGNPVDLVAGIGYAGPKQILPILIESQELDSVILIGVGWVHTMADMSELSPLKDRLNFKKIMEERKAGDLRYCRKLRELIQQYNFPILLVSTSAQRALDRNLESLIELLLNEIMLYPSIEQAVKVLSAITGYYLWRAGKQK